MFYPVFDVKQCERHGNQQIFAHAETHGGNWRNRGSTIRRARDSTVTIFQITKDNLVPLAETRFDAEGIYERKDLQRVIKDHIEVLGDDLMVITEEYGGWADSNRRIDLLCLDRLANLVVVELKRSEDGGHMELQAVRYAAMVSAMTVRSNDQ